MRTDYPSVESQRALSLGLLQTERRRKFQGQIVLEGKQFVDFCVVLRGIQCYIIRFVTCLEKCTRKCVPDF